MLQTVVYTLLTEVYFLFGVISVSITNFVLTATDKLLKVSLKDMPQYVHFIILQFVSFRSKGSDVILSFMRVISPYDDEKKIK